MSQNTIYQSWPADVPAKCFHFCFDCSLGCSICKCHRFCIRMMTSRHNVTSWRHKTCLTYLSPLMWETYVFRVFYGYSEWIRKYDQFCICMVMLCHVTTSRCHKTHFIYLSKLANVLEKFSFLYCIIILLFIINIHSLLSLSSLLWRPTQLYSKGREGQTNWGTLSRSFGLRNFRLEISAWGVFVGRRFRPGPKSPISPAENCIFQRGAGRGLEGERGRGRGRGRAGVNGYHSDPPSFRLETQVEGAEHVNFFKITYTTLEIWFQ